MPRWKARCWRLGVTVLLLIASAACAPSPIEGGFDSPNSAAKLYAIELAVRENDRSAVGQIIEQLDSDDPAVRLLAIDALKRLTGRTYGYRHYDSRTEREAAIQRWVQAYRTTSGEEMVLGTEGLHDE